VSYNEDDPFSDWADLIDKPVYSINGKKVGYLRKIVADYMVVEQGIVSFKRYFIPMSMAEKVSKKGIILKITAYEIYLNYSYTKMKNTLTDIEFLPQSLLQLKPLHDRLEIFLKYYITRNRIAAAIAFLSGTIFLLSGYKANIVIYELIRREITIYTSEQLWAFVLVPIGILAMLSQLGGIAVLIGAFLFAANRITLGKFWVMVGTGQGIITIALHIALDILSSSGNLSLANNYITSLTSSATGLGILFAIISQSVSKGERKWYKIKDNKI
jgi:hypothetical protein